MTRLPSVPNASASEHAELDAASEAAVTSELDAASEPAPSHTPPPPRQRHVAPAGFFVRAVMNRSVRALAAMGVSLFGARILWVRGRTTGEWRRTPVNPLSLEGERYLVAPRGHVQWTKNIRSIGRGELHLGRRVEHFAATEIPDSEKTPILRAYLRAWAFEVGLFFDGVHADSSDADLARIAPRHPIFRITATG